MPPASPPPIRSERDKGKGKAPKQSKRYNKPPFIRREKPRPEPGKFQPILDFTSSLEEPSASVFDIDAYTGFNSLVHVVAESSVDTFVRMNTVSAARADDFLVDMEASLLCMTRYYIASKLIKTANAEQSAILGPFKNTERTLLSAPIPLPVLHAVDRLGNFSTEEELWRVSDLVAKVHRLLAQPPGDPDLFPIFGNAEMRELWKSYNRTSILEVPVRLSYVNREQEFRERTVHLPPGFDFRNQQALDELLQDCTEGPELGCSGEVALRQGLLNLLEAQVLPPANERQLFAAQMLITFGVRVQFVETRPAQVKQAIAENVATYSRLFSAHLSRIWQTGDTSSLSEQGRPSQLMTFNTYKTSASSPATATPIDFAYSSIVNLNVSILAREPSSWHITQSTYGPEIQAKVLGIDRKVDY
jgi:hypothetical protein